MSKEDAIEVEAFSERKREPAAEILSAVGISSPAERVNE
jgi:hypothetical protein